MQKAITTPEIDQQAHEEAWMGSKNMGWVRQKVVQGGDGLALDG